MIRSGDDRSGERAPPYWAVLAAAFVVTATPTLARGQAVDEPIPAAPQPAPTALPPEVAESGEQVLLEADVLIDDAEAKTLTAEGDVQVRFNNRTLRADRLIYDLNTGEVHAIGNVEIIGDDGSMTFADEIQADEELNLGLATELRSRFGPQGTLAARSAVRAGATRSELRQVIYTSCPICEHGDRPPTWTLRARRAVQDQENRVISYQGATFEVLGLPILYFPYFAHPDPGADRHSGLLAPDLGSNRRLGFYYDQPYYWAISPYQDLTASLQVHENVNPLLGLEYRKRFYSGTLRIDGTVTQESEFDGSGDRFGDNSTRSSLFAQGRFDINNYWTWGFGAERVSDDLYLRRYGVDGYGEVRGPYLGDWTRLISQLYAVGQDDHSYASIAAVSFQGLRAFDSSELLPLILPVADYSRVFNDSWLGGQTEFRANTAVLERSVGRDSARASLGASWQRDAVVGPGLFVSTFAETRGDLYRVETTTPEEYETFGRGVGLAGAEISWPFMRTGENFDLIVEPVAMAAFGSRGGNDPRIINEDSIGFELDDSNLFRPNAVSNYDRWEPGARASLGLRASARSRRGELTRITFGRRWRDEAAPVFTVQNNLNGTASDWVGSVETDLGRHFGAEVRFRLDDEELELRRLDAAVRASAGRFYTSARYFQLDAALAPGNPTEEIAGTVSVALARGWSARLDLRRDLDSDINVRQDISAIYQDDCTYLMISYSRSETSDRTLGPDQGFVIRIGLTSLGMFGGQDGGSGRP